MHELRSDAVASLRVAAKLAGYAAWQGSLPLRYGLASRAPSAPARTPQPGPTAIYRMPVGQENHVFRGSAASTVSASPLLAIDNM